MRKNLKRSIAVILCAVITGTSMSAGIIRAEEAPLVCEAEQQDEAAVFQEENQEPLQSGASENYEKDSAVEKRKKNAKDENEEKRIKFENAVNFCNNGNPPTVKHLVEYLDMKENTLRDWIKKFGYVIDKNTHTVTKCENNVNTGDH